MLTGVVMVFHLFGTQAVGWAVVLHFAAVGIVVSGLIVHVYMGAVFPEEKPAFFSMITGNVNELYAYSHHFKWWRELMVEERQWEQAHEDHLGGPPDATGAGERRDARADQRDARAADFRARGGRVAGLVAGPPPACRRGRHASRSSRPSGPRGAWSSRPTPGGIAIVEVPEHRPDELRHRSVSGEGVVDHEGALPAVLESGNLVRPEPAGRHGVADDVRRDKRHAFSVEHGPDDHVQVVDHDQLLELAQTVSDPLQAVLEQRA